MFRLFSFLVPQFAFFFADGDGIFSFGLDGEKEEQEDKNEESESEQGEEQEEEKSDDDSGEESADDSEEEEEKEPTREELAKMNQADRAIYLKYKKEKNERQQLRAQLDSLILERKMSQNKEQPADDDDILSGLEDSDVVTVADMRKLLDKQKQAAQKQAEADRKKEQDQEQAVTDFKRQMDEDEQVFKTVHTDYDQMSVFAQKAMQEFPELALGFQRETAAAFKGKAGADPIQWLYNTGKKFAKMYADTEKKDVKEDKKASRIIKNAEKRQKSTGVTSASGKLTHTQLEDMEGSELASYLYNLSVTDYKAYVAIPKRIRDRALNG